MIKQDDIAHLLCRDKDQRIHRHRGVGESPNEKHTAPTAWLSLLGPGLEGGGLGYEGGGQGMWGAGGGAGSFNSEVKRVVVGGAET